MENGGITSIFHLSPRPSEHPYDHKYHKNRPDVGQYKAGQAYDAEKDAHFKKNHTKYYKACAQAHIPLTEIQKMNMAVSGIGVFPFPLPDRSRIHHSRPDDPPYHMPHPQWFWQ